MYSFRKKINVKFIDLFLKLNNFKIRNFDNDKKILLVDRNLPESNIVSSYFAYILNKKYKYNIYLLNNLSSNNDLNKIYNSFNIKNEFNININKVFFERPNLIIKSIFLSIPTILMLIVKSRKWFIEKFKINKIHLGDIVYDTYVRNDNNYDRKKLFNLKFIKLIIITYFKFLYIENLIKKYNFNYIISNTHTYISNSAIAMRIGLNRKIKIINLLSSRIRFYEKLEQSYKSELCLDLKMLKKNSLEKNWKKKIDIYLSNRFKGKIKQQTTLDAYSKKNKINLKKFFLKRKYKKIILFAPHAFSDANHGRGKMIFDSYYHQFLETLSLAKQNRDYLWIIRNHPSNYKYKSKKYKFGEEEIVKNVMSNFEDDNLVYCPKNISTYSLINFCDLIITGRGSIGIESAVLGKKALLCGESFYSNLGITMDPKNIDEYKKIILSSNKNYQLKKDKVSLAKKIFYMFAFKNSHIKEDMIKRNNYIEVNFRSGKLSQNFFSIEEYLEKFLNSLKRYKNKIIYDKIFENYEYEFISHLKKNDKNFKKY